MNTQSRKTIVIEYCTGCRWLLRSSWMAQEILTTFEKECIEVCLRPCPDQAGHFQVLSDQCLIWCRKRDQGFPELKILKQKIRDHIAPDKDLGHSDSES
jgi:selenoprotein W-related protein